MYLIEIEEKTIFIKNVLPVNGNGRNKKYMRARECNSLRRGRKKREDWKRLADIGNFIPSKVSRKREKKFLPNTVNVWTHGQTLNLHAYKQKATEKLTDSLMAAKTGYKIPTKKWKIFFQVS